MRLPVIALLPFALLAACQAEPPKELAVRDAWVRLSPVPGRPAAAYFTLEGGGAPERLVAVESAKVATIELHESMGGDGKAMAMKPLAAIDVPAGSAVSLLPGGRHAMLFGVDPSVKPDATLPLILRFAGGRTLKTQARTVAAGSDAPDHGAH